MEAPSHVDKFSLRNHCLRVPFHAYYKKSKKSYVYLDFLDCCNSQLKNKQKMKIADWMYEAYKKQISEGISNEEAAWYVREKIDEAQIWCPNFDIEKK